jgi:hypothetical protein
LRSIVQTQELAYGLSRAISASRPAIVELGDDVSYVDFDAELNGMGVIAGALSRTASEFR